MLFTGLNEVLAFRWGGWKDFYKLPKNSVDILFIGNSHNYMTFQPQVVDDLLSMNSYVLGVPGESAVMTYFELNTALRYQHPRIIVFETNGADRVTDTDQGFFFRLLICQVGFQ
jgi:hypothetical protein